MGPRESNETCAAIALHCTLPTHDSTIFPPTLMRTNELHAEEPHGILLSGNADRVTQSTKPGGRWVCAARSNHQEILTPGLTGSALPETSHEAGAPSSVSYPPASPTSQPYIDPNCERFACESRAAQERIRWTKRSILARLVTPVGEIGGIEVKLDSLGLWQTVPHAQVHPIVRLIVRLIVGKAWMTLVRTSRL